MKLGLWVVILGILAVVAGGAMYLAQYHRTIGEIGVGLGIVLLVIGGYMWMKKDGGQPAPAPQPAPQPQ